MENIQDMLLVNSLVEGCKPYSAVAILKSRSEMSEPGAEVSIDQTECSMALTC